MSEPRSLELRRVRTRRTQNEHWREIRKLHAGLGVLEGLCGQPQTELSALLGLSNENAGPNLPITSVPSTASLGPAYVRSWRGMMAGELLGLIEIGDEFFKRLTGTNPTHNSIGKIPRGKYLVRWNAETQTLEVQKEHEVKDLASVQNARTSLKENAPAVGLVERKGGK